MLHRFSGPRARRHPPAAPGELAPLGRGRVGLRGVVAVVGAAPGRDDPELERRLLEIGFVEGASVEILHQGAVGGDPIAVRLDDMRVALRRREADAVMVRVDVAERVARAARA